MLEISLIALGFFLAGWVFWLERKNAELEDVNDALCTVLLGVAAGTHEVNLTKDNKVLINIKGE
jgi:hypothetical protein